MGRKLRSRNRRSREQSNTITLDMLQNAVLASTSVVPSSYGHSNYDGDKWQGSFGNTVVHDIDYETLRARSIQMFDQNLYARGIVNRFVTNIVNTGLHLECEPNEQTLGMADDTLADWCEATEGVFQLWGQSRRCDYKNKRSFGRLQQDIKRQALIEGDVLVLWHVRGNGKLRLEVLSGALVQDPHGVNLSDLGDGRYIEQGIEFDEHDREVAYYVLQKDNTYKRIPTFGPRSGRRMAKLVRGVDGLTYRCRGEPLISILLHSIRDLDRYRDATIRKALLNAIVTMFIKKDLPTPGTKPMSGGAKRRDTQEDTNGDGSNQTRHINQFVPGMILEELSPGESPEVHATTGTDDKAGEFEAAIIHAMSWALEVPPEIMQLAFSSNYSASQAAINEFRIFLNKERAQFADEFLNDVYQEWLLVESFASRLDRGEDIITAWRNRMSDFKWDAYSRTDWAGAIKPSNDMAKTIKAYADMIAEGVITRERACRELTGMKYSQVVRKLQKENTELAKALTPILGISNNVGAGKPELGSVEVV